MVEERETKKVEKLLISYVINGNYNNWENEEENASLEQKGIWLSLWRQWINIMRNLCMILKHNLSLSLFFEECKCRQKVYFSLPFLLLLLLKAGNPFHDDELSFWSFASYFKHIKSTRMKLKHEQAFSFSFVFCLFFLIVHQKMNSFIKICWNWNRRFHGVLVVRFINDVMDLKIISNNTNIHYDII